jgi:hypothetical protein
MIRDVNMAVHGLAFVALMVRLARAWAYAGSRWLLLALAAYVPVAALAAYQAQEFHSRIGPITYASTAVGALLLFVVAFWPDGPRQEHHLTSRKDLDR